MSDHKSNLEPGYEEEASSPTSWPTHPIVQGIIDDNIDGYILRHGQASGSDRLVIEHNLPLKFAYESGAFSVFAALLERSALRLPEGDVEMTDSEREVARLSGQLERVRKHGQENIYTAKNALLYIEDVERMMRNGEIKDIKLYRELIDGAHIQYLTSLSSIGAFHQADLEQRDVAAFLTMNNAVTLGRLTDTLLNTGAIDEVLADEILQAADSGDIEAAAQTIAGAGERLLIREQTIRAFEKRPVQTILTLILDIPSYRDEFLSMLTAVKNRDISVVWAKNELATLRARTHGRLNIIDHDDLARRGLKFAKNTLKGETLDEIVDVLRSEGIQEDLIETYMLLWRPSSRQRVSYSLVPNVEHHVVVDIAIEEPVEEIEVQVDFTEEVPTQHAEDVVSNYVEELPSSTKKEALKFANEDELSAYLMDKFKLKQNEVDLALYLAAEILEFHRPREYSEYNEGFFVRKVDVERVYKLGVAGNRHNATQKIHDLIIWHDKDGKRPLSPQGPVADILKALGWRLNYTLAGNIKVSEGARYFYRSLIAADPFNAQTSAVSLARHLSSMYPVVAHITSSQSFKKVIQPYLNAEYETDLFHRSKVVQNTAQAIASITSNNDFIQELNLAGNEDQFDLEMITEITNELAAALRAIELLKQCRTTLDSRQGRVSSLEINRTLTRIGVYAEERGVDIGATLIRLNHMFSGNL
jgi:hypothetical protein